MRKKTVIVTAYDEAVKEFVLGDKNCKIFLGKLRFEDIDSPHKVFIIYVFKLY